MNDSELLSLASLNGYAALYLGTMKIGPGYALWSAQLARLTPPQRLDLESKLTRHIARVQSEALGDENFAKVPLQKRQDVRSR